MFYIKKKVNGGTGVQRVEQERRGYKEVIEWEIEFIIECISREREGDWGKTCAKHWRNQVEEDWE